MNLQLKAIKHSEFASQETHCYQANLYLDGKKVGEVGNDGHGGCDNFDGDWEVFRDIQAYFKTLPPEIITEIGGRPVGGEPLVIGQSLENWCCNEVNTWLAAKVVKRELSKKVLFTKDGGVRYISATKAQRADTIEHVKSKYPEAVILNCLAIEEAIELYQKLVG